MSISGLMLGLINIGITVVLLLLVGAIVWAFCKWMGWPIGTDALVVKLYVAFVALVALAMLVQLIFAGHISNTWRWVEATVPLIG